MSRTSACIRFEYVTKPLTTLGVLLLGALAVACTGDSGGQPDGATTADAGADALPDGSPADATPDATEADAGCEGGARRCQQDTLEECEGGTWVLVEDCAEGGGTCASDGSTGASCMAPPCVRGTRDCDGDVLVECGEDGDWAAVQDCAETGLRCRPLLGGLPACMPGEPVIPELDPMSHDEALALAAYARTLRESTTADGVHPMAWSMVNISCQDRANALAWALALGQQSPAPDPPVFDETELTPQRVSELAAGAVRTVAMINITGPLATAQALLLPDGTVLEGGGEEGDFGLYYWAYHHGVVVNQDGDLRVIDLSTGDEPLPIDVWAHGFVPPEVECMAMSAEEHQYVWNYWLWAFANQLPSARPERLCGYTVTPIFTFDAEDTPSADVLAGVPATMVVQLGAFGTELDSYGVTLPEEQMPLVLSRYTAVSEAELCSLRHLNYCDFLVQSGRLPR